MRQRFLCQVPMFSVLLPSHQGLDFSALDAGRTTPRSRRPNGIARVKEEKCNYLLQAIMNAVKPTCLLGNFMRRCVIQDIHACHRNMPQIMGAVSCELVCHMQAQSSSHSIAGYLTIVMGVTRVQPNHMRIS